MGFKFSIIYTLYKQEAPSAYSEDPVVNCLFGLFFDKTHYKPKRYITKTKFTGRGITIDGPAWWTQSNVLAKNVIVCGVNKSIQGSQNMKTLTLQFYKNKKQI